MCPLVATGRLSKTQVHSWRKQACCFDVTICKLTDLSLASAGAVASGSLTQLAASRSSPLWLSPEGSDPGEDSQTSWLLMTSGPPPSVHTEELPISESSVTALDTEWQEKDINKYTAGLYRSRVLWYEYFCTVISIYATVYFIHSKSKYFITLLIDFATLPSMAVTI